MKEVGLRVNSVKAVFTTPTWCGNIRNFSLGTFVRLPGAFSSTPEPGLTLLFGFGLWIKLVLGAALSEDDS